MNTQIRGARHYLAPFFISASLGVLATAQAEVPVVDLGSRQVKVTPATTPATPSSYATTYSAPTSKPEQLGILFSQLQALQQEMAELRGLMEQQQNELQQLKQQQKDNYLDVDRRLSELRQQSSSASTVPTLPTTYTAPAMGPGASAGNEKESYDKAYSLLDKNQREEAVLAFRKHILLYPQGELTPNARYWLGQIYLSQAQLSDAEEQFTTLLKQYPRHLKATDAKFSLGKVYFQQGKKADSKKLIQEVAQSNTTAAQLAQKYLQDNF